MRILRIDNIKQNIELYGQVCPGDLFKQLKTCHFFAYPSYIDNNSLNSVRSHIVRYASDHYQCKWIS
jgi:hypothetical protein